MYLDHYHLKVKPFDLSPNPNFLWFGEEHLEALATLQYGIKEDLGFLLLTGDVGVGKTALIHRLIDDLESSAIVAHITDPNLGILDFFKVLATEFNITAEFKSKGEFLIELEKFLHRANSNRKKVLLIVDEAQRMNDELLDQIRVLSNIELSDRKLINIFFVGQPEFKTMLMGDSSRAMRQRIAVNYHINPLNESETRLYIEHRLKVAGATRKIFKSNAVGEIFRSTGGYPRAINILCDHALLTGYAFGLESIGPDLIKGCERELNTRAGGDTNRTGFQTPPDTLRPDTFLRPPRRSPVSRFALIVGICVVIGAVLSYNFLWPATRSTIMSMTQKLAQSLQHPEDTAGSKQLSPSENIEKEPDQAAPASDKTSSDSAYLSAPPHAKPEPPPVVDEEKKPEISGSKPDSLVAGRQSESPADQAAPASEKMLYDLSFLSDRSDAKPEPPSGAATQKAASKKQDVPASKAESGVTGRQPDMPPDQAIPASEKAPSDLAFLSARSDAKPEPPSGTATQQAASKKEETPVSTAESGVTGRQPDMPPDQVVHERDQLSAKPEVESDVTMPAQAGSHMALMAALPDAKPQPQLILDHQTPAPNDIQPENASSGIPPDSPITAKAESQFQPSKEQIEDTPPPVTQPGSPDMERRIRSFLQNYCSTYAAKDLDAFVTLFAPTASENGKPFESLLPKYQRNFKFIETIQYRIELQEFSFEDNEELVKIDGIFFLKWLSPQNQWRENSGIITMRLKENGASFLVQRLDYFSTHSKKASLDKP